MLIDAGELSAPAHLNVAALMLEAREASHPDLALYHYSVCSCVLSASSFRYRSLYDLIY